MVRRTRLDRWGPAALLVGTALLYLVRLDVSGWANPYYSAAAAAGGTSWRAFLFGSLDAGNAITIDKPPLAMWPVDLAVRAFGLSSWSVLVPQAVEGVAAVGLLHATVRRVGAPTGAALAAGAVFALTPVATLMFRYNNPDAALTLLLVGAGYAVVRALQSPRAAAWLALAGALVGLGFLTKMLEAFLVLPALATTYAVWAAVPLARRVLHLMGAAAAVVVAGGWWVALVELWPASSRPWVGGSATNSVIELAFGYNGVQRLTGSSSSTGDATGLAATNIARISRTDVGAEIMWLVPAALLLGLVMLRLVQGRPEHRLLAASCTMWLLWVVLPGLTFAAMTGIFHSYYTVILAPAIAALVGIGTTSLWRLREHGSARAVLGAASGLTTLVAVAVLAVVGAQLRWLIVPVLVLGALGARLLVARRPPEHTLRVLGVAAVIAGLAAPTAFSLATVNDAHVGSGPMAGPGGGAASGALVVPGVVVSVPERGPLPLALVELMRSGHHDWSAAAVGARVASAYSLASGTPVIAVGGYKGTDPAPSLPTFITWVREGRVHLFLPGGTSGPASREIEAWVQHTFAAQQIDGIIYYDLTGPPRAAGPSSPPVPGLSLPVLAERPALGPR